MRSDCLRDKNIVKYRKLLYEIQCFCKSRKKETSAIPRFRKKRFYNNFERQPDKLVSITDFERGILDGKQEAYNEVLRKVQEMMEQAKIDWENMRVRNNEDFIE